MKTYYQIRVVKGANEEEAHENLCNENFDESDPICDCFVEVPQRMTPELIASAPDLMDALSYILEVLHHQLTDDALENKDILNAVEKAVWTIAKADGTIENAKRWYESLIPEEEEQVRLNVPFNDDGVPTDWILLAELYDGEIGEFLIEENGL